MGAWAVEAVGCTLPALAACSIWGATETAEDRMLFIDTTHRFQRIAYPTENRHLTLQRVRDREITNGRLVQIGNATDA